MGFLRELVKSRSKPVLDHRRHDDVVWLSGDAVDMALVRDASAGDVMLRSRVVLVDPPALPPRLNTLVQGDTTDSAASPRLDPKATDVGGAFDSWLADWQAWAAVDRERRPAWNLHNSLQRAMQELGSRPESIELVLASGLLTLPASAAGESLRTHILTQPVTVERDESTGDLLVRLAAETSPRLEDTQLLTGMSIFDPTGSRALQENLEGLTSPIDPGIPVFLKAWAERSLTVPVNTGDETDTAAFDRTLVHAPALVLRKRGAFALVEYYDRMIAEAERDDVPVPLGLAQLVEAIEPDDRVAWLDRTGASPSATLADDPLFPLPANPEQREIIERLARDSGVVVEGPPGTGKTHTIANLVSALLAQGQRVLVTSEKAQALRVLRDKLPPEMQELCVAITDVGRGGSAELNRSVAEIATRKSSYNPGSTAARINDLATRRDQALSRRSSITERIRSVREAEMFVHAEVAPGYAGTTAAIVRDVTRRAERFSWLPGPLNAAEPSVNGSQLQAILELTSRSTPERVQRLQQALPRIDGVLPDPAELQQLCVRAGAAPREVRPEASWLMALLSDAPPHVLADIRMRCERLQAVVHDVRRQGQAIEAAADSVLSGTAGHLWAKTAEIPSLLQVAAQADTFVGQRAVETTVVGRHALEAYSAMATAMRGGAEWRGRFRKSDQQKAVEALGPVATVDGRPAATADAFQVVAEHLRALDCVQRAAAILADLGVPLELNGSRSACVNALSVVEYSIRIVNSLVEHANSITESLRSVHPSVSSIRSVTEAAAVADAAVAIAATADTAAARDSLWQLANSVAECFATAPSPESTAVVEAIGVGDYDAIVAALSDLDAARGEREDEELLASLRRYLQDGAPALAALVAETSTDSQWATRVAELDDAWAWRRAQQWVLAQTEEGLDSRLESELDAVEADIARLTAQLAAERAWRGCLERMTAEQVQALQAYRGQVANIGKGTGKYAEQYRAAARSAMQVAQGAVPAWVMPLQQVLASIPAEPGAFDVVIVDEASQADIASLFLLWLAPRVIVVGDDKQCAPSEVASGALDAVFQRLDNYLPDMPDYLRASLTPRDSLFSMLRTRFGQVVRLREHFRCMPEIINWSSNQFYRDAPLVPLRQFGSDRLEPLRTSYVEGGVVTGRDAKLSNRPEAVAIADAIAACLDDPAYDGKTFGVVVLQGQAQVDLIRNELLERIDGRQWDERQLRVGTPPDFQGDERHVVFLSMVIAPGQRVMARTDNKAQRAFNVAASRAQDQLWLFHSVTSDALRSTDLRHSLLTYMQSTSPAPADPMPAGVTRDDRHADFDSLFEQRVFLDITARGYHVNSQVEVNSRRIDLVVTGAAGRLAVECDGDAFHTTPEQRARDLERERELKRCGWEFWRIRESAYYLDPVGAMNGLWRELDRRGITPFVLEEGKAGSGEAWTPVELLDDESVTDEAAGIGGEWSIPEGAETVADDMRSAINERVDEESEAARDVSVSRQESTAPAATLSVSAWEVVEPERIPLPEPVLDVETSPMPLRQGVSTIPERTAVVPGESPTLPELEPEPEVRANRHEASTDPDAALEIASGLEPGAVSELAPGQTGLGSAWEVMPRSAIPREEDPLTARVLNAASEGAVTTSGLAAAWGLDRRMVRTAIKELLEAGSMVQVGSRRGTRYELASRQPALSVSRTATDPALAGGGVGDSPATGPEPAPEPAPDPRPVIAPRLLQPMVMAAIKRGPLTVAELERRLPVETDYVRETVEILVETGCLVRIADHLHLREDVSGETVTETGPDVAAASPARRPGDDRSTVEQKVLGLLQRGPATFAVLVRTLGDDTFELGPRLDKLVDDGLIIRVDGVYSLPRGESVGDRPPANAAGLKNKPQGDPDLPAAARATAKKLLFAAAWGAPVTLARAAQITRLPEMELLSILDELEQEQVLRRELGLGGATWARR
ncbi:AAA domain-containing protein [Rhodococcus sp. SGAir0479]|uniref:AAA domain-containing protein n=1 Tax=Rhodococcus sp. SGAir0479 TaxID=2567884 RepID=UPI003F93E06E